MALIRYFMTEKSLFFADLPVCSKTLSYPFSHTEKKIPNKSNSFNLSSEILFSTSYCFHRNMILFFTYFSPSDGTTFICCLMDQWSSHHQHLDHGYWLLWYPARHFSIRHSIKWQVTWSANVRMTLNRKWSEEKLKLNLIQIPSNLFSLIFNTYYKKEKQTFRSGHRQQTTGSPKLQLMVGTSKNMSKALAV